MSRERQTVQMRLHLKRIATTLLFASAGVLIFSCFKVTWYLEWDLPVAKREFDILIYPETVCDEPLELLTVVHSAPSHFERRMLVRSTWGQRGIFAHSVVFVVGTNSTFDPEIQRESLFHRDILQADFIDSYHNLTLKAITWLKWTSHHCNNTQFVLKTDDDTFINIFALRQMLNATLTKTILCQLYFGDEVPRDPHSKWFVSRREFKYKTYPPYCRGLAYLITSDLITPLYKSSLTTRFFWLEDVFVTGLITKSLRAQLVQIDWVYERQPTRETILHINETVFVLQESIGKRQFYWHRLLKYYE